MKIMESEYEDIINLPHHVSLRHPQMPMMSRAAQFAPFAALTGFSDAAQDAAERHLEAIDDGYEDEEETI